MFTTKTILFVSTLATLISCHRPSFRIQEQEDQEATRRELERFERQWLAPAGIAPPAVRDGSQAIAQGSLQVQAAPLRPEDAPWNAWPGPTSRLFNNRAGLFFAVQATGPNGLRWVPEHTTLEIDSEGSLSPADSADALLVPLITAALAQERAGLPGDLVDRTRAAGPYRSAYLPQSATTGSLQGVIAFPLPDPDQQIVAMRLTLSLWTPTGTERVQFLYE